jgi:hypothetical protein
VQRQVQRLENNAESGFIYTLLKKKGRLCFTST